MSQIIRVFVDGEKQQFVSLGTNPSEGDAAREFLQQHGQDSKHIRSVYLATMFCTVLEHMQEELQLISLDLLERMYFSAHELGLRAHQKPQRYVNKTQTYLVDWYMLPANKGTYAQRFGIDPATIKLFDDWLEVDAGEDPILEVTFGVPCVLRSRSEVERVITAGFFAGWLSHK